MIRQGFDALKRVPVVWAAIGLALLGHALVFSAQSLMARSIGALLIALVAPGLLLVEALLGQDRPDSWWERGLYVLGAGYGVIVAALLLLSYVPGPILPEQTITLFDAIGALLALVVAWQKIREVRGEQPSRKLRSFREGLGDAHIHELRDGWSGWLIAGMVVLALVAGVLRLPGLGYSEFQGDEARAVLRAADAIQGYEGALLTHKKGPAEILIPTAIYSPVERLNEATARLPFALANIAALFAIFLLGKRLFGATAGWIAAMLLALDGYFIGFARIVQYQSIVFLCVTLGVLVLHRLVERPRAIARYLTLAAIFLATGLLAHYEAVIGALPMAYLLYRIWQRGVKIQRLARAAIAPLLVGGALLAVFYVPFVLDPSFRITYAYITVNRIGGEFPYNNLVDFFERTTVYSTIYAFVLMAAAATLGLARIYRRNLRGIAGWAAILLLVAGVALSFVRPKWLTVGGQDHTWAFFALALTGAWLLPRFSWQERTAWLWFGAPMVAMLFFTLTPNTHVYGFYMGYALVAGRALAGLWQAGVERVGLRTARWVAVPVAAALTLLFANYAYWYFSAVDLEVLRTWRENRPWGYPVTYDMPTRMSIFGFPLNNGWKAVGSLFAEGVLDAPFDLHGKPPVADSYTRGMGYCPRDATYYLWHESVEPADQGYNNVVAQQIEAKGYRLFGVATVNGLPRLRVYTFGDAPSEPLVFKLEDYEERFDADLSAPDFEHQGPVGNAAIQHPLDFRVGEGIELLGYTLRREHTRPGENMHLTLYWQAERPIERNFSVFTQVIDMSDFYKAGQRDGEPGCNEFPTTFWVPGETMVDRYEIPIAPDAHAGEYTLLVGMYDGNTGERLPIFSADGQQIGDQLSLAEVTVGDVTASNVTVDTP